LLNRLDLRQALFIYKLKICIVFLFIISIIFVCKF